MRDETKNVREHCERCKTFTTHFQDFEHYQEVIGAMKRCLRCGLLTRMDGCTHDLIESDATGHMSCASCRKSFKGY